MFTQDGVDLIDLIRVQTASVVESVDPFPLVVWRQTKCQS